MLAKNGKKVKNIGATPTRLVALKAPSPPLLRVEIIFERMEVPSSIASVLSGLSQR